MPYRDAGLDRRSRFKRWCDLANDYAAAFFGVEHAADLDPPEYERAAIYADQHAGPVVSEARVRLPVIRGDA